MHVAVGVVTDGDGRVLICRRARHRHQGGLWEFPGGKVESGEEAGTALCRELIEELGIRPTQAWPLLRIPYRYPEEQILLDVWRVTRFTGVIQGREGQPWRWVTREELSAYRFPAANQPIITAACLPPTYLITPALADSRRLLAALRQHFADGRRALVQLRVSGLSDGQLEGLARSLLSPVHAGGGKLLISRRWDIAQRVGADGVHLSSAQLQALGERPLPADRLVAASCHNPLELAQACARGADFAVLSPVRATLLHPGRDALGWQKFAQWIREVPIPVYALGGVAPVDLEQAWSSRAQGVAGIRGFWPSVESGMLHG